MARLWALPDLTPEQRGWAGLWAGNANSRTARLHEAVDWYGRALAGVPDAELILRGRLLNAWAYALYVLGELEEGKVKVYEAINIFTQVGHSSGLAMAHSTAAALEYNAKDYALTLKHYQSAYHINKLLGDAEGIRIDLTNMAGIYLDLNEIDRAIELLNEGLELDILEPGAYSERLFFHHLYDVHLRKGNYAQSLRYLNEGITIADKHGILESSVEGRLYRIELLIRMHGDKLLGDSNVESYINEMLPFLMRLETVLQLKMYKLADSLGIFLISFRDQVAKHRSTSVL